MECAASIPGTGWILESLTPAQQEAVCHRDGPLLILAGPGSGKTRVVTHRIAHLLSQSVPARQIVALTFTNKAADEMRCRLQALAPGQPVWVGTFHRFCSRLLRQYAALAGLSENYSIYDTEDSRKLLREALQESTLTLTHVSCEQIADAISRAKNDLVAPDQFVARPGRTLGAMLEQVYPLYQRRLLAANAVDFDDLLLHVACLLRENPELRRTLDERYRYILVDEYQDTNLAQYAIVRALSQDYPNLAVTGDPDQSIYGWRGADLENILKFEHDFPHVRVVRLERNYRSTQRILRVADTLIAKNAWRKHKELYTENREGARVRLVVYPFSRDEAEGIVEQIAREVREGRRRLGDFAIFYRVNWLSRAFENALRGAGLAYQVVRGLEFYQRKEIKDVLAYLHLINNPKNEVAFLRIINTPPRKIGKTTVRRLAAQAAQDGCSLLDAARRAGLIESLPKQAAVHVATFVAQYDRLCLHAAAPLEELMGHVLEETGYRQWLHDSLDKEDRERLANVEELLNAAREFDEAHPEENRLEVFVEQVALVSDTDDLERESDKVSLMTLHAAKGLEFPVVFIVAVEQGLLPHERSREDAAGLEEERRLLFVGITRCAEELQLSMANRRFIRGGSWPTIPSHFLLELPREEMEIVACTQTNLPDTDTNEAGDWEYDLSEADEPAEEGPIALRPRKRPPVRARMMTAAEMAGDAVTRTATPDEFSPGMLINHPEHGPGKIMALSGTGSRRTATVRFFNVPRELKFILMHSQLQPVKSTHK